MDGPYRSARVIAAPEVRRRVEKPAPRLRVVRFSDGSSRVRIGAVVPFPHSIPLAVWAGLFLLLALLYGVMTIAHGVDYLVPTPIFLAIALPALRPWMRGETIAVTRDALIRKRRFTPWRRNDVVLLADVTTVVFSGEGETARLDLQIGRRRLELAGGLGHSDESLQKIAKALRQSLDDARAR